MREVPLYRAREERAEREAERSGRGVGRARGGRGSWCTVVNCTTKLAERGMRKHLRTHYPVGAPGFKFGDPNFHSAVASEGWQELKLTWRKAGLLKSTR